MAIGQELDARGITTPAEIGDALYQPAERLTHVETGGPLVGYGLAAYSVCQSQGGLVLGMPGAEAQGLLTRRQWREGDIAQLQAAAARLGLPV